MTNRPLREVENRDNENVFGTIQVLRQQIRLQQAVRATGLLGLKLTLDSAENGDISIQTAISRLRQLFDLR